MFKRALLLLVLLAGLALAAPAFAQDAEKKGDYVVLLHGIGRTSNTMYAMQKSFENDGYDVLNLDYPSREMLLEDIVEKIHPEIQAFTADKTRKVHFVGYSMGGLVIRAYLAKYRQANMGRVVMLGTPNSGSEVADTFRDYWLYAKVYGPAGQQLATSSNLDPKLLGKTDYEVGTIAGTLSIDPVSSFIIPGEDDGKVSVKSAHLADEKDHRTMATTHTFMPFNADVIKSAKHFIAHGKFPPRLND